MSGSKAAQPGALDVQMAHLRLGDLRVVEGAGAHAEEMQPRLGLGEHRRPA
jgi:hypothetical protein